MSQRKNIRFESIAFLITQPRFSQPQGQVLKFFPPLCSPFCPATTFCLCTCEVRFPDRCCILICHCYSYRGRKPLHWVPNIKRSPLAGVKRKEMVGSLTTAKPKLGAVLCAQLVKCAPSTRVSMELLAAESWEVWGRCTLSHGRARRLLGAAPAGRGSGRVSGVRDQGVGPTVQVRAGGCWPRARWGSARPGGERQVEEHPCTPRGAARAPRFLSPSISFP